MGTPTSTGKDVVASTWWCQGRRTIANNASAFASVDALRDVEVGNAAQRQFDRVLGGQRFDGYDIADRVITYGDLVHEAVDERARDVDRLA